MNKKIRVWSILALTINLIVMLGGIVYGITLLREGERTYHILVCFALLICGCINSIKIGIALRKK